MNITPIKTRVFSLGEDLAKFVLQSMPRPAERSLLVVTSKIVSLAEGRLAKASVHKEDLVREESDVYLGEIGYGCFLTIKHGLLIPSAGIDESNSATGDFILFPKDPFASAEKLGRLLKSTWELQDFGILITDSHTSPLRRGVTGIGLSYWGFLPVKNMVGTSDLFGRALKMTQMNLADGLAAAAVMMMGEGAETQPLALVENAPVQFSEITVREDWRIPLEEDLYYPLILAAQRKN